MQRGYNLQRLDLVSLSLINVIVRARSISKGAALASLAVDAAKEATADECAARQPWRRSARSTAVPSVLFRESLQTPVRSYGKG